MERYNNPNNVLTDPTPETNNGDPCSPLPQERTITAPHGGVRPMGLSHPWSFCLECGLIRSPTYTSK